MRYVITVLVLGLVAVALAGPAAAEVRLTPASLTGGVNEPDKGGLGCYRPFDGLDISGANNNGYGLGVAFNGQTVVESLTLVQFRDGWQRRMIEQIDVYANGERVGVVFLQDDPDLPWNTGYKNFNTQTLPILGLDGVTPISVTATWLTLVVKKQYITPDGNSAVEEFWFNGTPCDEANYEANLNLRREFIATGNYAGGSHGGHGSGSVVLDGNLHCAAANGWSMFWGREDGHSEQSFTVLYGEDRPDIGSVGIAFLAGHGDRNIPKWVVLSDSNGNHIKIDVDPMTFVYDRYDRGWLLDTAGNIVGDEPVYFDEYFIATESLKLTFPRWTDMDSDDWRTINSVNWWTNSSDAFGLTEFQAFADRVPAAEWAAIPEPATMTLLLLGGLAMWRRRK